jgi:hypothetical protein
MKRNECWCLVEKENVSSPFDKPRQVIEKTNYRGIQALKMAPSLDQSFTRVIQLINYMCNTTFIEQQR